MIKKINKGYRKKLVKDIKKSFRKRKKKQQQQQQYGCERYKNLPENKK